MVMTAYISKKPYNACFIQEIPVVIKVNNKKCFRKKKKKEKKESMIGKNVDLKNKLIPI